MHDLQIRLTEIVASQGHARWQKQWHDDNGNKPRIKKTKDEVWIAAHGGITEVDIAATNYVDLPADWQEENRLSAEVAVSYVLAGATWWRRLFGFGRQFVEAGSAIVHVKWLERNGEWAEEHQKLPYHELNEIEKEKDRVIIRNAIDAYKNSN